MKCGIILMRLVVLERKTKLCSAIEDNFPRKKKQTSFMVGYLQGKKSEHHRKSKGFVLTQTLQEYMVMVPSPKG